MKNTSPIKIWRDTKHIRSLVGKEGKILHFTIIRVPPGDFSVYGSYPVAIVLLANGGKTIVQIVDANKDTIKIGKKVKLVLRRSRLEGEEDIISYNVKGKLL